MSVFVMAIALSVTALGAEDAGIIRVVAGDKVVEYRPDGKKLKESPVSEDEIEPKISPDGKQTVYVKEGALYVADKEGKDPVRLSPKAMRAAVPMWSPDGTMIAFSGRLKDTYQLQTIGRDGKGLREVTDWPQGVEDIRYRPDGKLSYLRPKVWEGKFQPSDLVLIDGDKHEALVKDTFISDYAWSPDGKTLAYGKLHAIAFVALETKKSKEIPLSEISDQLFHHAPVALAWKPDSSAVACRLPAHVGRAATISGEPPRKIFGDDELFVIPQEGKSHWFVAGDTSGDIQWVKTPN
jgi:dipeptidyl aminopeptidase/acylaminoacyl peptidase